jgi:peptidoglycan/LPS O-acetylase OafA/YrhL
MSGASPLPSPCPSAPPPPPPPRVVAAEDANWTLKAFEALTGLRGVLALWVFCHHHGPPLLTRPNGAGWLPPDAGSAVTFFFVLAGFVLTHAQHRVGCLLRSKRCILRYVAKRLFRIMPLYWLSLAMCYGEIACIVHGNCSAKIDFSIPLYFFGIKTWFPFANFDWNTPVWSVQTELFFYCSFPLVLYVVKEKVLRPASLSLSDRRLTIALVVLALIGVLPVSVLFAVTSPTNADGGLTYPFWLIYTMPYTRIADFIMGTVAYFIYQNWVERRQDAKNRGVLAESSNSPAADRLFERPRRLGSADSISAPSARVLGTAPTSDGSASAEELYTFTDSGSGSDKPLVSSSHERLPTSSPLHSPFSLIPTAADELTGVHGFRAREDSIDDAPSRSGCCTNFFSSFSLGNWLDLYTLVLLTYFFGTSAPWGGANTHLWIICGGTGAAATGFILLLVVAETEMVKRPLSDTGRHRRAGFVLWLLRTKFWVQAGEISFAFYCFHVAIFDTYELAGWTQLDNPRPTTLFLCASVGIAVVAHAYVELPIMKWGASKLAACGCSCKQNKQQTQGLCRPVPQVNTAGSTNLGQATEAHIIVTVHPIPQ